MAINNLNPDFVVALGDLTDSGERSEFLKAKSILKSLTASYIPMLGNHDTRPYARPDGEAEIPGDCYFGEYFYNIFADIFYWDSLHFARWKVAPHFSTPDISYNSYYFNSAFTCQNFQFVNVDHNTREHAIWRPGEPWPPLGTQGDAKVDVPVYLLGWITQNVNDSENNKTKLLYLGHQPLITRRPWRYYFCYTPHEVHQISDAGLKNNRPIAYWIGGHVHGDSAQRIDTTYYDSDTVAVVFTLNGACKDGTYGYVRVYDKAKARIDHYPSAFPLPVTLQFQAGYGYIGDENECAEQSSIYPIGDLSAKQAGSPI